MKHKPKPNNSVSHFSPCAWSFATRLRRVDSIFFLHSLFSAYRSSSLVDDRFSISCLKLVTFESCFMSRLWRLETVRDTLGVLRCPNPSSQQSIVKGNLAVSHEKSATIFSNFYSTFDANRRSHIIEIKSKFLNLDKFSTKKPKLWIPTIFYPLSWHQIVSKLGIIIPKAINSPYFFMCNF